MSKRVIRERKKRKRAMREKRKRKSVQGRSKTYTEVFQGNSGWMKLTRH